MSGGAGDTSLAEFECCLPSELRSRLGSSVSNEVKREIRAQLHDFGGLRMIEQYKAAVAHDNQLRQTGSSPSEIMPPTELKFQNLSRAFQAGEGLPAQTLAAASLQPRELDELTRLGLDALCKGEVAIVVLAGGQGTRLGYDGPKGCYELDLPSKSSVYKILMTRIAALGRLAKVSADRSIPVYIMTSEQNDAATRQHFAEHKYFGLNERDVVFFTQTVMPSFDAATGCVLFEDAQRITRNPNGNGGVFASMADKGVFTDIEKRGIKYLHVHGIDNVLVKSADPLFIGACLLAKVPAANKCCVKNSPYEKVGVQVNKRNAATGTPFPSVVEYTEISAAQAEERDAKGHLRYSAANIVNHFFKVGAIKAVDLHYHVAYKKVPFYDFATQQVVRPAEPNAVKLEYFIFDAFEALPSVLVFEVAREDEFSPVKNAEGADSPATARRDIGRLHAGYLKQAGLVSSADETLYEIAPGATYAGEGLGAATPFQQL